MTCRWIVLAAAALVAGSGVIAGDPAFARDKHSGKSRCNDRPAVFSWSGIFTNTMPRPNGCAPPVYQSGTYIGQDPDPFIRQELRRDPRTGYLTY